MVLLELIRSNCGSVKHAAVSLGRVVGFRHLKMVLRLTRAPEMLGVRVSKAPVAKEFVFQRVRAMPRS